MMNEVVNQTNHDVKPIQVFLGYRNVVEHLLTETRVGGVEEFTKEVEEWCDYNLRGGAYPTYVYFLDEEGKHRGRYEFVFFCEEDVVLFKLFWIN